MTRSQTNTLLRHALILINAHLTQGRSEYSNELAAEFLADVQAALGVASFVEAVAALQTKRRGPKPGLAGANIQKLLAKGLSGSEVARELDISRQRVSKIKRAEDTL